MQMLPFAKETVMTCATRFEFLLWLKWYVTFKQGSSTRQESNKRILVFGVWYWFWSFLPEVPMRGTYSTCWLNSSVATATVSKWDWDASKSSSPPPVWNIWISWTLIRKIMSRSGHSRRWTWRNTSGASPTCRRSANRWRTKAGLTIRYRGMSVNRKTLSLQIKPTLQTTWGNSSLTFHFRSTGWDS